MDHIGPEAPQLSQVRCAVCCTHGGSYGSHCTLNWQSAVAPPRAGRHAHRHRRRPRQLPVLSAQPGGRPGDRMSGRAPAPKRRRREHRPPPLPAGDGRRLPSRSRRLRAGPHVVELAQAGAAPLAAGDPVGEGDHDPHRVERVVAEADQNRCGCAQSAVRRRQPDHRLCRKAARAAQGPRRRAPPPGWVLPLHTGGCTGDDCPREGRNGRKPPRKMVPQARVCSNM